MSYEATRDRVETYFDRTATKAWEALTSDAPVSRIRATVRAGRDAMREKLLSRLPRDLSDLHILDAGSGTGQLTHILAAQGANVTSVDISPALIKVARDRIPVHLQDRVQFIAGDMLDAGGPFDHVVAMDSLIYYDRHDLKNVLASLLERARSSVLFTVAPRTPLLMGMWYAGQLFPRKDRSPTMIPQAARRVTSDMRPTGHVSDLGRITSGFYISQALELTR